MRGWIAHSKSSNRLPEKLGLRIDDVRAEHEGRGRKLIDHWHAIAPKSQAAVFEFEFDADDVQSLLKRVEGYPTEHGIIARATLSFDWLSYFCAKNDLLARDCKATLRSYRIVEQPMSGIFPPRPADSSKSAVSRVGVPYKPDTNLKIDDWSQAVFRSFADWTAD
jgi:hypothetical protein